MLTQKETSLLKDLKKQEQVCVDKYQKYAAATPTKELKDLFNYIEQQEDQHLQSLTQIENGTVPATNNGGQSKKQKPQPQVVDYSNDQAVYQNDAFLCTDALSTEKYVSSTYDTSIFEFVSPALRNVLNHIQKEEQEHGEMIYSFMSTNGMYN